MAGIFFERLNDSSIFTFFVPFLLVFAIVYGILSKIDIFSREDDEGRGKRLNIGISIIIGLIFASVSLATDCLSAILPRFAIAITVLLVFYMVMGLMVNLEDRKSLFNIIVGILAIAGFVMILFLSSEACGLKIGPLNWFEGDWWKWVVGVIIVGGLFVWMIKGSGSAEGKKDKNLQKPKPAEEKKPELLPEGKQRQGPTPLDEDGDWEDPKESVSH